MANKLIENSIYDAIIAHCEDMEAAGSYKGNGHHLAQRLTNMVSIGLLPKNKRKIYDALTIVPQLTKDIAEKVGMPPKTVSAQLKQMQKNTLLVHSKVKNKRRKLWHK